MPTTMPEFGAFYAARRERLVVGLRQLLGSPPISPAEASPDNDPNPAELLAELNAYFGTSWRESDVPALPPDPPGSNAARDVLKAWAGPSRKKLKQWSEQARRVLEKWWELKQRGIG